jgi:hypothetical protein
VMSFKAKRFSESMIELPLMCFSSFCVILSNRIDLGMYFE